MKDIDIRALFQTLADLQPDGSSDAISTASLVKGWLAGGPRVLVGAGRSDLEALCRQIDVRKRVSTGYAESWKRLPNERPAAPPVVAGLVAVLLANAEPLGGAVGPGELNDGWSLKCINSAYKALDLADDGLPHGPELAGWAAEQLDRAAGVPA